MSYESLEKVKFRNEHNFIQEYEKRINGYGTLLTNLKIFPFNKKLEVRETKKKFKLFVVSNIELIMIQEKINNNADKITRLLNLLPEIAKMSFIDNVLINEIQSTNDIEGVRSTRQEIEEALLYVDKKNNRRFTGIVKLYKYLFEEEFTPLTKLEEIREIYNDLVFDEITNDNELDGFLFRKGSIKITQGEKVIHRGNPDEESIVRDLNKFLDFLNSDDFPYLIKVMLSHYFFEYIHPFYDGNGRTGRYITCKYLSDKLDPLTALSFSRMINYHKEKYYKAFDITSRINNCGEGTMFVFMMLDIVLDGQKELIRNLEESKNMLDRTYITLESDSKLNEKEREIMFLMSQSTLFNGILTDNDISEILGIHRNTLRPLVKGLEDKMYIYEAKKRPTIHKLTDTFIKKIVDTTI